MERKMEVVIRETNTGEVADGYIVGGSFKGYNFVSCNATEMDQIYLTEQLIENIGKNMSKKSNEKVHGFVALMLKALENGVGKENYEAGVKLHDNIENGNADELLIDFMINSLMEAMKDALKGKMKESAK